MIFQWKAYFLERRYHGAFVILNRYTFLMPQEVFGIYQILQNIRWNLHIYSLYNLNDRTVFERPIHSPESLEWYELVLVANEYFHSILGYRWAETIHK